MKKKTCVYHVNHIDTITNYATTNTTIPRINHDITLFLVLVLHLLVLLFAITQDVPPASYAYHHFPARVSGVHVILLVAGSISIAGGHCSGVFSLVPFPFLDFLPLCECWRPVHNRTPTLAEWTAACFPWLPVFCHSVRVGVPCTTGR